MSTIRIRSSAPDPYAGLRGHDYIRARGLSRLVQIKGMRLLEDECQCAPCVHQRLLSSVLRICASYERRKVTAIPQPHWNNPYDDVVHELLDELMV